MSEELNITHAALYECTKCNAKFKTKGKFERHDCSLRVDTKKSESTIALQCTYCGKVFKRFAAFHKHNCEKKQKYETVTGTMLGKRSYLLFQMWTRLTTKIPNATVEVEQYLESSYCSSFINFVEWSKNINLPDVEKFIRVMVSWKFPPKMWTRDDVYVKYIDFIDRTSTVDDHIRNTFDTLKKLSNAADCPLNEAITQLNMDQILVYIRARKLSPWVLLKMTKFKKMYNELNNVQKTRVASTIQPHYWVEKFTKFPNETNDIIEFVALLDL